MDVVVLGLGWMKVLKPSRHHQHCSGIACLKGSVTCGQWPSIRRHRKLDRVCWVLDLVEECWFLSEVDAPLLYMLLGLGPQPWSGLCLRSRRAKIGSVVDIFVIIFSRFSLFQIVNILFHFCDIDFTLPRFPGFGGNPQRSPPIFSPLIVRLP
jgi:hypothetical protein